MNYEYWMRNFWTFDICNLLIPSAILWRKLVKTGLNCRLRNPEYRETIKIWKADAIFGDKNIPTYLNDTLKILDLNLDDFSIVRWHSPC